MQFEFGKYTDITELAFEVNPSYKRDGFVKFFICPDVWDFWFVRIVSNTNGDYEYEEGSYVLERNKIEMSKKGEKLTKQKVRNIISEDDGSNWDFEQSYSLEDLIEMVDGGFGILNIN